MADGQVFNVANLAFNSALWSVKPNSGVEIVQTLWLLILNTWFPPTGPYKMGINAVFHTDNTRPNGVILEIQCIRNGSPQDSSELREQQIFILECKRPSADTPAEWEATTHGQFVPYLEANLKHPNNRLFVAVAIGRKVKFWQWDRNAAVKLIELHPGIIDMDDKSHRPILESYLTHIKASG